MVTLSCQGFNITLYKTRHLLWSFRVVRNLDAVFICLKVVNRRIETMLSLLLRRAALALSIGTVHLCCLQSTLCAFADVRSSSSTSDPTLPRRQQRDRPSSPSPRSPRSRWRSRPIYICIRRWRSRLRLHGASTLRWLRCLLHAARSRWRFLGRCRTRLVVNGQGTHAARSSQRGRKQCYFFATLWPGHV